jgi:hypothetical protein
MTTARSSLASYLEEGVCVLIGFPELWLLMYLIYTDKSAVRYPRTGTLSIPHCAVNWLLVSRLICRSITQNLQNLRPIKFEEVSKRKFLIKSGS